MDTDGTAAEVTGDGTGTALPPIQAARPGEVTSKAGVFIDDVIDRGTLEKLKAGRAVIPATVGANAEPLKAGLDAAKADMFVVARAMHKAKAAFRGAVASARTACLVRLAKTRLTAARWLSRPFGGLLTDAPAGLLVKDVASSLTALNGKEGAGAWSMTWTGRPAGAVEVHLLHVGLFRKEWRGPGFRIPTRKERETDKPRVVCKLTFIGRPERLAEFIAAAPAAEAAELAKQETEGQG